MTRSLPHVRICQDQRRLVVRALLVVLVALGLGLLLLPPQFAQADEPKSPTGVIIPTTGERFSARLTQATSEGVLTFAEEKTTRTLPLAKLVRWGALVDSAPPANPTRGAQVFLADGGRIIADRIRAAPGAADKLLIESALFEERKLPIERISAILLQPPLDVQQRDRLAEKLLARAQRADRLLLENGDELNGSVVAFADAGVEFDSAGQKINVPWLRVTGVSFDPSLATPAKRGAARTLLGFADGSRLVVSRFTVVGGLVEATLGDGSVWQAPTDSLVCVQPLAGPAKYLSDQKAEGYRHLPFLSLAWPYKNDANVTGAQLRAGGHPYAKGIGMHSAARLTYRLAPSDKSFEADLALDDQVGGAGSAIFSVYVDDRLAFKSDVIRGGAAPTPVKVDTTGGKRLSLMVEFADRGDEQDHANWLDARLLEAGDASR